MLFSIPLNTTHPDRPVTSVEQAFDRGPAEDFFSSIKAYMDLDDSYHDKLTWKLQTERRSDPPHRLLTFLDFERAFDVGKEAQMGRKKLQHTVDIINMVSGYPAFLVVSILLTFSF